ncbi:MAG: type I 3-dehydroquinate dehydratase [Candidatus Kapabacteria bacterium]|nr:type I 3-dehydroquinate dehydratase [Candidatus Kapabacteria bacterium]
MTFCLSYGGNDLNRLREIINEFDLVEIRLDLCLLAVDKLIGLINSCKYDKQATAKIAQIIITNKNNNISDSELTDIISLINSGVEYVDIDLDMDEKKQQVLLKAAENNQVKIILSYHNYTETPTFNNLLEIFNKCNAYNPEIIKIVCKANSKSDCDLMLSLYSISDLNKIKLIAFASGELGKPSRTEALKLGCPFMYVADTKGIETAEGQMDYRTMKDQMKKGNYFNKNFYAVTGNPILHSKSPLLFNKLFKTAGNDCYYTRLGASSGQELANLIKELQFKGISVTAPFKSEIIPYLDEISNSAKLINAVNCIINDNNRLIGHNTDWIGIIKAIGSRICYTKSIIFGAGGAARASIFAMTESGSEVTVVNRTFQKAIELATEFNCKAINLNEINEHIGDYDIIISTINHVYNDLDFSKIRKNTLILDAIYHNPPLKDIIKKLEMQYIFGNKWLIEQGLEAYKIFIHSNPVPNNETIEKIDIEGFFPDFIFTNTQNVFLIGFSGSGKSSIGNELAKPMGFDFLDIDYEIEKKEQVSVKEIFKIKSEEYFRKCETDFLLNLATTEKTIISCGAGIITNEDNRKFMKDRGIVIFLHSPLDVCLQRINQQSRPILENLSYSEICSLYNKRLPLYIYFSDFIIDSSAGINIIVERILKEIKNLTI